MYKLLVVDDEARDRNIVKILVEKQYAGLFEILEAKSGTQALEILHETAVDLMLLDLNMPGLSGLGVMREIRASTYVIILTAYSFFDYAREALHYGVKDYVLKPPIRAELYGAIDRFLQERQSQADYHAAGKRALFRELATQLLFYGNPQKIEDYCRLLGIGETQVSLAVLLRDEAGPAGKEQSLTATERFLDTWPVTYAAAAFRGRTAVVFFWRTQAEAARTREAAQALCQQVGGRLAFEDRIPRFSDIPQTFIRLCEQGQDGQQPVQTTAQSDGVETALRGQNFAEAMRLIAETADQWDYRTQSDTVKFQLLSMLSNTTKHLFANADQRGAYAKLSALLGADNKERLMDLTAEYLHWLIGEIKKSVYTNSYVVHRVIDAVKMDCAKSWTMEGLAAELKISPYYLSHLFKEYTGSSFTDYLAEFRIERAVELMKNPELSLAQIGDMVGYADQNYFSRVFKKRRGIGARQFRKQLLSE